MPSKDGKWRILALDGGGVRGLFSLGILNAIEQRAGKPLGDVFDCIVGTSTGGLLALGLCGTKPLTARALSDLYHAACPKIFARSAKQRVASLGQLNGPKYNNDALYRCAYDVVGGSAKMGEATTPCMVTTYDLAARTPRFLTSWDTPEVLMLDAAMSTTAAPTYFAPWHDNVDGGVCDNSPALSGVIEWCRRMRCTVRDCLVVSVGTGNDMQAYSGAQAASWGLLTWAEPLVSLFTDGTSMLHDYHLRRLLPDENVLRLQGSVQGAMADLDNASPYNLAELHSYGGCVGLAEQGRIDAMLEAMR